LGLDTQSRGNVGVIFCKTAGKTYDLDDFFAETDHSPIPLGTALSAESAFVTLGNV
jgi:hypothetical protein